MAFAEAHVLYFAGVLFMGVALGSSPCLRGPLAACWRPKLALPIAAVFLAMVARFLSLVFAPAFTPYQHVAPIFGMAGLEATRLLWALSSVMDPPLRCLAIPQAVETARELGLMDLLSGAPVTPEEAAVKSNATENGVRCLMNSLAEAGVFVRTPAGAFHHTWSKAALSYMYAVSEFSTVVEYPTAAHLTEAVKTGKPAGLHRVYGPQYRSLYHARSEVPKLVAWTNYMNLVNKMTVANIFAHLGGVLQEVTRLLDICGNEGQNAILFAQRYPAMHITVHDLPAVIEDPERGTAVQIRRVGLAERVSVFPWDLSLPGGIQWPRRDFDAVQLVHCINEWPLADLRARLVSVRDALLPGGRLLIVGAFTSSANRAAAFQNWHQMVYFLTATGEGASMYEVEQLVDVAREAGFVDIKVQSLEFRMCVVSGRKPK